jgi:hypothetical protein
LEPRFRILEEAGCGSLLEIAALDRITLGVFGSAFFWPAYLKSWLWGKAGCWEKLVVRI